MRIVTWNVNSLGARLDFVLDFLAARGPDIVCLQELKLTDEAFPHLAFEGLGYGAFTHGQSQWNGVGVLVKKELDAAAELVSRGLPGQEALGARLCTVRAAGLSVTSVYVPNGKSLDHPDYASKLAFLEALAAHAEQALAPQGAAIVAGDFNVVPGDLDTWDPVGHTGALFHTPAERAPLARLADAGFVDLFRAAHPDLVAFSWWDYRAGAFHKRQGLRIDLLLGRAGVKERVVAASVDRDFRKKREGRTPSDHAPVVVELR